jgi:uncharacterized membrane protein
MRYLVWNLFLAWVPFVLAIAVYDGFRRRVSAVPLVLLGGLWLLFLPNAPYIVTDFIHLDASAGTPLWYDAVTVSAFAWTGLLLGFASLYLMHAVVRAVAGAVAGWAFALSVLAVSSFGVYVGRVQRMNSWDVLVQPRQVLAQILPRLTHPVVHSKPVAIMLALTIFLALGYLVVYSFTQAQVELDRRRERRT